MKKTIIFLALFCMLAACNSFSETTIEAPQVIETPPEIFSPTESQAVLQFENLGGEVYYVGGENCSDGGGSAQTPFCTFTSALEALHVGDTLNINPGFYQEPLIINDLAGQPAAPILIQGQEGVVFDGGCTEFPCGMNDVDWGDDDETGLISVTNSQHLILQGLRSQNVIAVGLSVFESAYITITDVTVDGTGNAGLLALHSDHLTITHNDIGRAQLGWRNKNGRAQVGAHEALSIVAVNDFEVAYNRVHDILKEGIDIKENSAEGSVHHNVVERVCSVGIYLNECERVQVYGNQIRRSGYYWTEDGQESLCENYPEYGRLFDRFYGTGILLAVGDLGELSQGYLGEVDLYQNVIWDSHGNGIEFWDEMRETRSGEGQMSANRVFNNTIYKTGLGGIRLQDVDSTQVVNNILAFNNEDAITGNAVADNEISHNLFYFENDGQDPLGTDYVVGDPLFVDPAAGDYHVMAASPAIDAGLDMGLAFGGTAADIGAFEADLPQDAESGSGQPDFAAQTQPDVADGLLANVSHWFYMIDVNLEPEMVEQMAASEYDMLVLDFIPSEENNTDYPMAAVIDQLHAAPHPKLVIAYIDVGQAEEFRTYWQPDWGIGNPEWIVGADPDGWEGNFPVVYWHDAWHDIWLGENGYLQAILDAGFDGVYLDWVEAYSDENVLAVAQEDGVDPRQEMIWWVGDIAEFTRAQQPDFIVIAQNAAELAENDEYLDIIDAIAQEQVWFDGGADNEPPGDCPLPQSDADIDSAAYRDSLSDACRRQYDEFPESTLHVSSAEYLAQLSLAQRKGTPIFTVDYALDVENIAWVYQTSRELGFVPFVGNRALNQFVTVFD